MKKSILAVVILLLMIATLPTIGNSFIQNSINERVIELQSFGLQTSKDETHSSYLKTSRHFEFLLKDSQAFLNYLKQYSGKQIPPYVNTMLEGVLMGTDIKYSNFPFAKAFEIEIYPMKLSPKMTESLKRDDEGFYKYTKNFLLQKGMLYHIEYNLLNNDFKGYIKDIKESYTLSNNTKLTLSLEKANFKGNGALLAAKELSAKVKKFHFEVLEDKKSFNVDLRDFKSTSSFDSANTYRTSVDIETIIVSLRGTGDDVNISMQKLRANALSDNQGEKVILNSKTSIKSLEFSSKKSIFKINKFNIDLALSSLDKKEYAHLTELLSQNNALTSVKANSILQTSVVALLSKGILLDIADLSVEEFSTNNAKEIKGFDMHSNFRLKADKDLAQKMKISPLMVISNISVLSEIKISKKLYTTLQKNNGMFALFNGYEKEDGEDYIFTLKFEDSRASINSKSLN